MGAEYSWELGRIRRIANELLPGLADNLRDAKAQFPDSYGWRDAFKQEVVPSTYDVEMFDSFKDAWEDAKSALNFTLAFNTQRIEDLASTVARIADDYEADQDAAVRRINDIMADLENLG